MYRLGALGLKRGSTVPNKDDTKSDLTGVDHSAPILDGDWIRTKCGTMKATRLTNEKQMLTRL